MEKLRDATLVFLIVREHGRIVRICLAMKKRGFGMGRLNGVGGKVEAGESLEDAAKREANEEIGVTLESLEKVAELEFRFPHNPAWNQRVSAYLCDEWSGEPTESEEMDPKWHSASELPFSEMWPDDEFWLPLVVAGEKVRAEFTFGEGDVVAKEHVEVVSGF